MPARRSLPQGSGASWCWRKIHFSAIVICAASDRMPPARAAKLFCPSGVTMKTLWLKKGEDRRIRAGHLWIFSNEIDSAKSPLPDFEAGENATLPRRARGNAGQRLRPTRIRSSAPVSTAARPTCPWTRTCCASVCKAPWACASASTTSPGTACATARAICCPAWSWTVSATTSPCRSAPGAWKPARKNCAKCWANFCSPAPSFGTMISPPVRWKACPARTRARARCPTCWKCRKTAASSGPPCRAARRPAGSMTSAATAARPPATPQAPTCSTSSATPAASAGRPPLPVPVP